MSHTESGPTVNDPSRYFDHASTTPLDPLVLEEMRPWLEGGFGNPNSLHSWGRAAAAGVDRARIRVAALLGCEPEEVVFTSGATESNNWVLRAFSRVAVSPFEHSSAKEPAEALGHATLANDGYQIAAPEGVVDLVSVMTVNNETGARLKAPMGPWRLHRDATQSAGKVPLEVREWFSASVSAHKFYGPKGVGALYVQDADPLEPLLRGGEQESGQRAGTLNVAGIVGMGAAASLAHDRLPEDLEHAQRLRQAFLFELAKVPDWRSNGAEANSPSIMSVSFQDVEGETLVVDLDVQGYAVSSGAACSSRSTEPSHVLTALGLEPEWRRGTVRVSFGRGNTLDSTAGLARALRETVERLRTMAKRPRT